MIQNMYGRMRKGKKGVCCLAAAASLACCGCTTTELEQRSFQIGRAHV